MARVEITTAGHTVVVEDSKSTVEALATLAERVHERTRDPGIRRGYGTTVGFQADLLPPAPAAEYGPDEAHGGRPGPAPRDTARA